MTRGLVIYILLFLLPTRLGHCWGGLHQLNKKESSVLLLYTIFLPVRWHISWEKAVAAAGERVPVVKERAQPGIGSRWFGLRARDGRSPACDERRLSWEQAVAAPGTS
jgi:hypothetical protein